MTHLLKQILWCTAVFFGIICSYFIVALIATTWITDTFLATVVIGILTIAIISALRITKPEWIKINSPQIVISKKLWILMIISVVFAFIAGQTMGLLIYDSLGSSTFEQRKQTEDSTNPFLVIFLIIIIAPWSEELLLRGFAYPLFRKNVNTSTSILLTTLLFAFMHGNIIQAIVTIPLGILLALIVEFTHRIWPVIIIHILFNTAATLIPSTVLNNLVEPIFAIGFTVLWGLSTIYLYRCATHTSRQIENRPPSEYRKAGGFLSQKK